ncbi:MAG: hypothetical protein ACI82Q_000587 [Nonlabens sp.]
MNLDLTTIKISTKLSQLLAYYQYIFYILTIVQPN